MSENQNTIYKGKTPQEMAAIMQERVKGTFSDFLEMKVVEYREGFCRSKFIIKPEYANPLGGVHGGFLFTIADTTGGMASVDPKGESAVTTVNGNMQFMNAVLNCDVLYAEATVLKAGKRIVYTDVLIKGEEGTVYAKGSYTFARIVLPGKASSPVEG